MDLWSHPTSAKLRESADASLAAAQAALAARQAKLQGEAAGAKGAPQSPSTPAAKAQAKPRGSGHTRAGSRVVRNPHTGDKVRVQPRGDDAAEPAAPAPQVSAALKGMNVRGLRQRARTLGVDEEEITTAVEGNDPKKALISIIQGKEGPGSGAEPAASAGGGAAAPAVSAALKGMSVRSLRQRARELGVEEAALTAAIEGADPHNALIKLIQAKMTPAGGDSKEAGGDSNEAAETGDALDTLPAMLRAALEAVEAVETGDSGSSEAGGVIIGKQLNRMKQTYIADLSAALAHVEGAIDAPFGSTPRSADDECGEAAAETGRVVSLLEGMERELLQDLLLGPLPVAALAAVSQACKGLLAEVRSPEMQSHWNTHWVSRWWPPFGITHRFDSREIP